MKALNSFVFGAVLLLSGTQALAANAVDPAKWQSLIQRIEKSGEATEMDDGTTWISLGRIVPNDLTKSHLADYISTVGVRRRDTGKYEAFDVEMVSENWQLGANGNWTIDQWLYGVSIEGTLKQVHHFVLVEASNGTVLDDTSTNESANDPANQQRWTQKLAEWF